MPQIFCDQPREFIVCAAARVFLSCAPHQRQGAPVNRRDFHFHLLPALLAGSPLLARAVAVGGADPWEALESRCDGRLGVAVLRPDGTLDGHRMDERFPMCSTFKWIAAACVLQRVDRGQEKLDRRIAFGRDALQAYSPVTGKHVGEGMTVGELCDAAVTLSDNGAANLLLASFGGPATVTAFARGLGDGVTRLDRIEPELNEARPGDPRDTTSPAAMAKLLRAALTGDFLSPASRKQLAQWMEATQTNAKRLRAHLPPGWRMGSKTGTGALGSTNDVGFFYAPGASEPIVVAVYITEAKAPQADREGAIAQVARRVTAPNSSTSGRRPPRASRP
jgi:beta-lactamase class A